MKQFNILIPLFAQVLLTYLVWQWLVWGRVSTILRTRVNPQKTADDVQARIIFKNYQNQSDNLENLFELPVLFFAAGIIVAIQGISDAGYFYLAWAFVFVRAIHSIIHCTINRITLRFYVYLLSSYILWCMWIRLSFDILFK